MPRETTREATRETSEKRPAAAHRVGRRAAEDDVAAELGVLLDRQRALGRPARCCQPTAAVGTLHSRGCSCSCGRDSPSGMQLSGRCEAAVRSMCCHQPTAAVGTLSTGVAAVRAAANSPGGRCPLGSGRSRSSCPGPAVLETNDNESDCRDVHASIVIVVCLINVMSGSCAGRGSEKREWRGSEKANERQ